MSKVIYWEKLIDFSIKWYYTLAVKVIPEEVL
jgi:hypothetical protein